MKWLGRLITETGGRKLFVAVFSLTMVFVSASLLLVGSCITSAQWVNITNSVLLLAGSYIGLRVAEKVGEARAKNGNSHQQAPEVKP